MNFRDGEQSSEIRSLLSFLRVLSFNLLAHLHRRVLTRGPPQQERFPELFTGQLVNFVPLLFISAVIDSVIHIFSSRFFGFSSPFLFVLRAERPSVIRARPPAVNVVRLVKQTKKKEKKNIYIYIYILAPEFGNKSLAPSLAAIHSVETPSPSWQFTGLTTRLREPRFAATRVPSRLHFVLFRGRKSSALNFKREVFDRVSLSPVVVVFAPFTSKCNRLVKLELASLVGDDP